MRFKSLKLFLAYSSFVAIVGSGLFFSLCRSKSDDFDDYVYRFSEMMDDDAGKVDDIDSVLIAAHRGHCDDYVENTNAAFENASNSMLVDYIEVDVRLTSDNKLVVVHNNSVLCDNGQKLCISTSNEEDVVNSQFIHFPANALKDFLISLWNDTEGRLVRKRFFSTYGKKYFIPSVDEAFASCGEKDILLDLKFKDDFERFENALFCFLDSCYYEGDVILQSADLESLKRLQEKHPNYTYSAIINSESDFEYCDSFDVLGIRKNLVGCNQTLDALKNGKDVLVWTINSVDELNSVRCQLGDFSNNIIYVTDYPNMVAAELNKVYCKK